MVTENEGMRGWIHAEDAMAEFFRNRGFRVQQQVKVGSEGIIDVIALWRRTHEKHHFLIECKDRIQFSRSNEKDLVNQLHRYLKGYAKTKMPKEHYGRRHIIVLVGICTNTYFLAHRQIPFKWDPKQLGSKPGRRVHAVRCYITTPSNLNKVLNAANIPLGCQCRLNC